MRIKSIILASVILLSHLVASNQAEAQCQYLGGYPWKTGGCLVADDLNNAIAGRNPFLNFSTVPHKWVSGFKNGEPILTQPSYSDLIGTPIGQISPPSSDDLGGVYSFTAPANQFLYSLNPRGEFASRQPNFLDLSGVAAPTQIPFPTESTIGGVKAFTAPTGLFVTGITPTGDYTTGAPPGGLIVADNTALSAASTVNYPNGVWRNDYAAGFGATPLFFRPQDNTCTATGFANDAGSCVNSANGKSWFAIYPENRVDLDQFGAVASIDSTSNLQAALTALAARGGGTLTGNRIYRVDGNVTAGSDVRIDMPGTIDASKATNGGFGVTTITYAGSITPEVNLGANATTDDTTLTTASATGWNKSDWFILLGQRCAVYPEAGYWRLGYPTATAGSSPLFAEVKQIENISGTTITPTSPIFYPAYNITADVGSTCPSKRASSTVAKISWVKNVYVRLGHYIGGGDNGSGFGKGVITLRWALNPVLILDDVQLGYTASYALLASNVYGGDINYSASRPGDFQLVLSHNLYNSARIESSWNTNVKQHDVNGMQGTDVSYSSLTYPATGLNINISGDSINSRENGATFHSGTLYGSIGPFECIDSEYPCIVNRSRRINIHDINAIGKFSSTQAAIVSWDTATESSITNVNLANYFYGVRLTRFQSNTAPPDNVISRNVTINNITCDNVAACIMLGADTTYDTATNLDDTVTIRNVQCTRCDIGVYNHAYWNGTDIDGVKIDTTGSRAYYAAVGVLVYQNNARIRVGAVTGVIPAGRWLVQLSSLPDTTTFPPASYPWGYHNLEPQKWRVTGGGRLSSMASDIAIASNYTLQYGDHLRPRQCSTASPVNVTIPPQSDVPFGIGQSITLHQVSSGSCAFVAGAGVSLSGIDGLKTKGSKAVITATQFLPDYWTVTGQTAP